MRSRVATWIAAAPPYRAEARDLATVRVLGLELPVRATVATVAIALLMLLDFHGRIDDVVRLSLGWLGTPAGDGIADWKRIQSIGRLVVEGAAPLLVVVLVMRDRPSRYGLRLGDWRAGIAVALAGVLVMTPVVLLLVLRSPGFGAFYAPQAASPLDVVITTALEVVPAEFFFRGFLLFALLRAIGPMALVIATLPFAFMHLGKPELETLSTLVGGFLYGWLDWRSGSVLWSGLAHTYILALAVIASGAAAAGGLLPA